MATVYVENNFKVPNQQVEKWAGTVGGLQININ